MLFPLKAFLALLFVVGALSHPTKYPKQTSVNCSAPATIMSYHIHIVFSIMDDGQIQRAEDLRSQAREYFAPMLGEDCDGRYDEGRLCLIYDHNITQPGPGPWPSGEWSMFVPISYYEQTIPWFTQHRGEFSLLVHPNSGCEYEDHSIWALWGGEPWPLNFDIFEQNTQTNEFGSYRGDSGNPVCLSSGAYCGDLNADGPAGVCCLGLQCNCYSPQCFCGSPSQTISVN